MPFQKVEEFLDKGVHFALTSAAILGTNSKGELINQLYVSQKFHHTLVLALTGS